MRVSQVSFGVGPQVVAPIGRGSENYMKQIKQISSFVLSIVLLASTPLLADKDSHIKDKPYITNAIRKMDIATQNKDLNGYLVFLRPDYTDVGEAGVVNAHNKAQMREQMSRMFARATSITVGPTTVTRFVFDKQGAIVYESGSLSMTLMVSGQASVIQADGTYQDLWVKTAKGWLKKRSASLSSKTTLNGKPVP